MQIDQFTRIFFEMEMKHHLFDLTIDDIAWWDVVRFEVAHKVFCHLSKQESPVPSEKKKKYGHRLATLFLRSIKWLILKWKMTIFNYDYIAFRCPRGMLNGKRADYILDPLLAKIKQRGLLINTYPIHYHLGIRLKKKAYNTESYQIIDALIFKYFNVRLALATFIAEYLGLFQYKCKVFNNLLHKVNPKVIFMVQNGIEKSLFYIANVHQIPVVEMQHGLINVVHLAYSYPTHFIPKNTFFFPTHFLTFSDYWQKQCYYPVKSMMTIGCDSYYYEKKAIYPHQTILFISADIYHKDLSVICKQLADKHKHQQFIYKLHPNQRQCYSEIKKEFISVINVSVVLDDFPIQQLIYNAHSVFLIQSTVLYEALQAGRQVFIIAKHDYKLHEDVFECEGVHIISNAEDGTTCLQNKTTFLQKETMINFFEKTKHDKIKQFVSQFF